MSEVWTAASGRREPRSLWESLPALSIGKVGHHLDRQLPRHPAFTMARDADLAVSGFVRKCMKLSVPLDRAMSRLLKALTLLVSVVLLAAPATAQERRWPAHTSLPRPAPEPSAPPAILVRAPEVVAMSNTIHPKVCRGDTLCVICVANCADNPTPSVIHAQAKVLTVTTPVRQFAENDSDGVIPGAPAYVRPSWSGITCGATSGCIASGIKAPPRPLEADIRITVINRYID